MREKSKKTREKRKENLSLRLGSKDCLYLYEVENQDPSLLGEPIPIANLIRLRTAYSQHTF